MSAYQKELDCIDTKTLNVTLGEKPAVETIRGALLDFGGAVARDIAGAGRTLLTWPRRASQRRHLAALAALDARLLRDMGISREDALAEARKPFWQA